MKKVLYQVGRLDEFIDGKFGGIVPASEVLAHGDTGVGTFEGGDGEMIILNGRMYQAVEDCSIVEVPGEAPVPLANACWFETEKSAKGLDCKTLSELERGFDLICAEFHGPYYMVCALGNFSSITVRSEKGQKPPYKPLAEFLSYAQREYTWSDVIGTLLGLYFPPEQSDLNAAGWHFHFITLDGLRGGHVLDLAGARVDAEFDLMTDLELIC